MLFRSLSRFFLREISVARNNLSQNHIADLERYPSVFQEMIRYVFPKGEAKDGYTEEEIMRLMNHINSYPRKKMD